MSRLIVEIIDTGVKNEIENVDLEKETPRQLIDEMIKYGHLPASTSALYTIINKCNVLVSQEDLFKTFDELGFVDGDEIKIICKPAAGDSSLVKYPNDQQVEFTYESMPYGLYFEDKVQLLFSEKIALSQLEHLKCEEKRCRGYIEKIRYSLKDNECFDCYCQKEHNLTSMDLHILMTEWTELDKMRDLLEKRLYELQESPSILDRLRGHNELRLIEELLIHLEKLEIKQKKATHDIEYLYRRKINEVKKGFYREGARLHRENEYLLESYLSEYERELNDLLERRRNVEKEIDVKKKVKELDVVYSSIFAPAEVKRKSHFNVQVYLHLVEETERVKALAQEAQKGVERRDYIPLQCRLKRGDKVDILLNIYGETLLMFDKKSVIWQGSFTKCSFGYCVPGDIDVDELSCVALITVNSIPVGEMRFVTNIVETPRNLNPEIISHKYKKVFISYAHNDEEKVKLFHEGLKLFEVEHFFDRAYLEAGDIFPRVIQDYINTSDLFVLFWSENASKSEYVEKERKQALERACPQVQSEEAAKLRIYPLCIEPRAELPNDMKGVYHFGYYN